jgi:hypothetical protein
MIRGIVRTKTAAGQRRPITNYRLDPWRGLPAAVLGSLRLEAPATMSGCCEFE